VSQHHLTNHFFFTNLRRHCPEILTLNMHEGLSLNSLSFSPGLSHSFFKNALLIHWTGHLDPLGPGLMSSLSDDYSPGCHFLSSSGLCRYMDSQTGDFDPNRLHNVMTLLLTDNHNPLFFLACTSFIYSTAGHKGDWIRTLSSKGHHAI
jgi:hypothetical protein